MGKKVGGSHAEIILHPSSEKGKVVTEPKALIGYAQQQR